MVPRTCREWLTAQQAQSVCDDLATRQGGALGRAQLLTLGVPRWFVRRQLKARRWQRTGRQTVVVYTGPLDDTARRWVAVLEHGRRAALAGVTALQAAGMEVKEKSVHVALPPGARLRPTTRAGQNRRRRAGSTAGVRVHETRRFDEADVVAGSQPRRIRPAVAAVQAALWAHSDRQVQLFILMTVQQRLATAADLTIAAQAVRRDRRRRLLLDVIAVVQGGVQSLGELDIAADFRKRGFPAPERQQIRQRPSGRHYLDVAMPAYRLVFEIDGIGHDEPQAKLDDLLRDLAVNSDNDVVIRIPLVAYQLDRERVLDGIAHLLNSRGWTAGAAGGRASSRAPRVTSVAASGPGARVD